VVLYAHPVAGRWFDLVCKYADGRSATFTTARTTGLNQRPRHAIIHVPGASPEALYRQGQSERPVGELKSISASTVAAEFENAYAEATTWRKQHGISADEVAKVAARRKVA